MTTARVLVRSVCLSALLLAAAALGACGGGVGTGGSSAASSVSSSSSSSSGGSSGSTSSIALGGSPSTSVAAGSSYSFTPTLTYSGSASVVYSIANKPSWATFNTSTGELSGTPSASYVGTYAGIAITATAGGASATLSAFTIAVSSPLPSGSAALSWTPPTQNTDGTALTNLAGYYIWYGSSSSNLTQRIQISNAATTSYTVTGLSSGTVYFAVTSYTTTGVESALSTIGSKTIS